MNKNNSIKFSSIKSPKHWAFFMCLSAILFIYFINEKINIEHYLVLRSKDSICSIQILLYAFIHKNYVHLISNLIIFYILYRYIKNYFSDLFIWVIFFIGILFGGIGFITFSDSNFDTYLMGISAGNLGWFIILSLTYPKSQLFLSKINFQFKYIAIFIVIFHLTSFIIDTRNSWQAHLGALFLIPIYLLYLVYKK